MSATVDRSPRLLAGIVLAPLTPGILFLCISIFGRIGEGLWALKLSAMVGYPAMVVLGIPAYFVLRKLGWNRAWGYLLAGLIIGTIVAAVIFTPVVMNNLPLSANTSLAPSAAIFMVAAVLGVLSGTVFWAIARPDC
jgi:hypothetical protein